MTLYSIIDLLTPYILAIVGVMAGPFLVGIGLKMSNKAYSIIIDKWWTKVLKRWNRSINKVFIKTPKKIHKEIRKVIK